MTERVEIESGAAVVRTRDPRFLSHPRNLLGLILLFGLVLRLGLFFLRGPEIQTDTPSYQQLADQIRTGNYEAYTGARTPAYPLLLLSCGMNLRLVALIQIGLALAICAMLFQMTLRRTGSLKLAGLVAFLPNLSMPLVFYDLTIMTENLSAFFLVLSAFLTQRILNAKSMVPKSGFLLGLVAILAGLTRPALLFLGPLLWLGLLVAKRGTMANRRERGVWSAAYLAPFCLLLLVWCGFNKAKIGAFTPSTLTGFGLMTHAGAFVEDAPAKFADIRDVYIRFRDPYIAEHGEHTDEVVWRVGVDMRNRTGANFPELSRRFMSLSLALIAKHPADYLASVSRGWVKFWIPKSFAKSWNSKAETTTKSFRILLLLWTPLRLMLMGFSVAFLALCLIMLFGALRHRSFGFSALDMMIFATILGVSVTQALGEYGSNWRYCIPIHPLLFFAVCVPTWLMAKKRSVIETKKSTEMTETSSADLVAGVD